MVVYHAYVGSLAGITRKLFTTHTPTTLCYLYNNHRLTDAYFLIDTDVVLSHDVVVRVSPPVMTSPREFHPPRSRSPLTEHLDDGPARSADARRGRLLTEDGAVRPMQRVADAHVEDTDECHRDDEEDERRQLEDVAHPREPLLLDVADERFGDRRVRARVDDVVVDARVDGERQRGGAGEQPDEEDRLEGAVQAGHRLRAQRVADRHVALDGEGGDGEDGRR